MIVVLVWIESKVWNIFSKYTICSMNTSCKQNMSKNGQKTCFFETSWEDIFTSMLDMMIWFEMDGNDIPKCLLPQYETSNTHSAKTLRPYAYPVIRPIFGGCFWDKWNFRQHWGQHVLTKLFFPERPHQTEQKTFLHLFHISLSFFCTWLWILHVRQIPFINNRVHFE